MVNPRLNWGCGPDWSSRGPAWTCSDAADYGQHHVGDIRAGLPWGPGTFEAVVTVHTLSALRPDDVRAALRELHRVTMPGGWLRVVDRDPMLGIEDHARGGTWLRDLVADEVEPTLDGKLCRWLTWHGEVRSLWTAQSLIPALVVAGWGLPVICKAGVAGLGPAWTTELDNRRAESFYVEATA